MARALQSYVVVACDMCDATTVTPVKVIGTPEMFCSLQCCKIFYSRPAAWISQHRKEVHA